VTTGTGFKCSDGIVLATDSQHTVALKTQEEKLYEISGVDTIKLRIAGAGSVSLIRKAVELIANEIYSDPPTVLDEAEEKIEKTLGIIYAKCVGSA